MDDASDLDCKIYVEAELKPEELAGLVASALAGATQGASPARTVHTPHAEIDVRKNREADAHRAREFPDGFLYFRYALELYPRPAARHADRVSLATRILEVLWSRSLPAVAACAYEDELPNGGGYKSHAAPWPPGGGEAAEKGRESVGPDAVPGPEDSFPAQKASP
jgi:hypothetical protein